MDLSISLGNYAHATTLNSIAAVRRLKERYSLSMQPIVPTSILPILNDYLALLDRWNHIHALTSLEPPERFEELILDSAALLPFLDTIHAGQRMVDFGTGMGVPSVVLAAARPDLEIIALDKSKKKMAFLSQVAMELGLSNLKPITTRAEDLSPLQAAMGAAKAVGSLSLLTNWWERHQAPGAPLLALKGPEWEQEPPPPSGWSVDVHPYQLPHRGARFVVRLTKTRPQ
jgi:16S rRNA (guanine527-N7)-methyltransferase